MLAELLRRFTRGREGNVAITFALALVPAMFLIGMYNQWVAPFQSQIATSMQSCASPGLYFAVSTDGDITSAMQALFQQAVATARLSN